MPTWLGYILALAALVVLAPLMAWVGHTQGRNIKGGLALASIMLGFGVPLDPPTKHLIEATEDKVKGENETGEPPDPDVTSQKPSSG